MPYINQQTREQLAEPIRDILLTLNDLPAEQRGGAFDYIIFLLLRKLTEGEKYHVQRGFVGDVVWSLLEWYRRFGVPYEDEARKRNGDIG